VEAVVSSSPREASSKRPRSLQPREAWDKVGGIVRCIRALCKDSRAGELDLDALDLLVAVEEEVQEWRRELLNGLKPYYSDAQIGERLGKSRQAVWQERTGRR
jgi:hypothetical protein